MLIRSQNKEVLVTLELLFDIEVSGGVISARKDHRWCCLLGKYSTKAKVLKVLDMIQEAYAEYEIVKTFGTGMGMCSTHHYNMDYVKELEKRMYAKAVFQMPEDSEVEV